jgi:Rieske 2Fe-2S family protein
MDDATLAALIGQRRTGFTLPRAFYTDPAIFERDLEHIFMRQWLFAGHISQIAQPGDYRLYQLADESLILLHGSDGVIRAFFNVCRHRGSRICRDEAGQAHRLVCPYHAWVYDDTGALIQARHMPEGFERGAYGLQPVQVQVVEGLIFVCAAADPPPFGQIAGDIARFFGPYQLAETRVAHVERHLVAANWKVVAENFFECYHCSHTHPEFCSVMSYGRAPDSPRASRERAAFVAEWHAQAQASGWPTGSVDMTEDSIHTLARTPIRLGYLTQSEGGGPVAPLLGRLTGYDGAVTAVQFYPVNWLLACSDHAMLARFTPRDPTHTELMLTWLVQRDARPGHDYDPLAVSWLWRVTAIEDATICEDNQRGISSRRYAPGPYASSESSVEHLITWYLRQIAPAAPAGRAVQSGVAAPIGMPEPR